MKTVRVKEHLCFHEDLCVGACAGGDELGGALGLGHHPNVFPVFKLVPPDVAVRNIEAVIIESEHSACGPNDFKVIEDVHYDKPMSKHEPKRAREGKKRGNAKTNLCDGTWAHERAR